MIGEEQSGWGNPLYVLYSSPESDISLLHIFMLLILFFLVTQSSPCDTMWEKTTPGHKNLEVEITVDELEASY